MTNIFKEIFKEYPPMHEITNDPFTTLLNIVGDGGICIFFGILAYMCFFSTGQTMPQEAYLQRKRLTMLLGMALLSCAISRGLNVLALWHNYMVLNGILKNITNLFAISVLGYFPYVVKYIKEHRALEEIKKSLNIANKNVEELTKITKKVIDREA